MSDTIYLVRHGQSLVPLDEPDRAWLNKKGSGELIAFDRPKVKDRDPVNHCRLMRLIRTAFEQQPDPDLCARLGIKYFTDYEGFRRAWVEEVGFVVERTTLRGEVIREPISLKFSETHEDTINKLKVALRNGFEHVYGSEWTEEIFNEVARLAGGGNW